MVVCEIGWVGGGLGGVGGGVGCLFLMESASEEYQLCISARTCELQSPHGFLYNYEEQPLQCDSLYLSLKERQFTFYRHRTQNKVVIRDSLEEVDFDSQTYMLLAHFRLFLNPSVAHIVCVQFMPVPNQLRMKPLEETEEEQLEGAFLSVGTMMDMKGNPRGYQIQPGLCIKLGDLHFYVSEVLRQEQGQKKLLTSKLNIDEFCIRAMLEEDIDWKTAEKDDCRICLMGGEEGDNFLFKACSCLGTAGWVHVECLREWLDENAVEEAIGDTVHYKYRRLQCEACRIDYPLVLQMQDGRILELTTVVRPQEDYFILEGACEELFNVVVVHNVPEEGIYIGGENDGNTIEIIHQTVSEDHVRIRGYGKGRFALFDNGSKFGTLVFPEDVIKFLVWAGWEQSVQMGRTLASFTVRPARQVKEEKQKQKKRPNNAERIEEEQ